VLPVPAGLPPLRLALSGDPMLRDNEVTLAEPRPRIVGVENRLKDGRGRQALLKAVAAATGATTADPGHLVFMDAEGIDRAAPAGAWRVGFGRPPAAWLGGGAARDFIGPFVLEKRHPLLLGITLGGVVWTGALPIAPAALRPIASAGDQLLIGTTAAGDPAVLVNVDLDRTNLIRSPDWPIFISNLVEARRQALPGPERWNYRIGEWVRVRLGRDPKGPLRLRCGAVERTLPPGRELEFPAPAPGGLLQIVEGSDVLFELGVNFLDEREGDLRQQATADSGAFSDPAGLRAESGPASDPLFWILLACGGLALVGNWLLLSPRRAIA
jgi:hypothetical protein